MSIKIDDIKLRKNLSGQYKIFEDKKITVDKLLDVVDMRLDWYVPSDDAIKFIIFLRLVLGEEPENSNPKAHYFMMDCIFKSPNVIPYFEERNINFERLKKKIVILCTREFSKALDIDTKIATPDGYIAIKDLNDGDTVYDRNGDSTKIIKKSRLFYDLGDNTYKITLEDGREIITNSDHENIVWKRKEVSRGKTLDGSRRNRIFGMEELVVTSSDLYRKGVTVDRDISDSHKRGYENKYYIPRMSGPIKFPHREFSLDPYTVGVMLGDGRISKVNGYVTITCHKDDFDTYKKNIPYEFGKLQYKKDNDNVVTFGLLGLGKDVMRDVGTENSYGKRIPAILKIGSINQRLSVLQGLMDTDGTINKKGSMSFTSTSKGLAEDVQEIVRSLGGQSRIVQRKTPSTFGKVWTATVEVNGMDLFRLERKRSRQTYVQARDYVGIKSIEIVHTQPTQCLAVDSPTQSFILENGLITHNSVLVTFLILFMADEGRMPGFGRVNYGIYVSDSMRNGVKNTFNTLEKVYLASKYLRSRFEDVRFTDSEMNLTRKPRTKKEIELYEQHVVLEGNKPNTCPDRMKRTFSVKGVGAETGTRGTREALSRPQFAIFDDLISSEKDAESDTILENIDSTIDSDVLKGLSGNGHFAILIGTPYNKKDPVYRRIEEGTWLPVVFPRAREMYEGITEEEFTSVWPDRHKYENCVYDFEDAMIAKDKGNSQPMRKLMQEHYLRISSDEDRMISDKMINWYNRSQMMSKLNQYNLYMTTDFTTTGNAGSDLSGTVMWALGSNGDWFLLDLSLRKKELTEQYNDVFNMVNTWTRYNYRGVTAGVEVDGGQRAHIQALKDRMVSRNEWFTIGGQRGAKVGSEGITSRLEGGNKHWRFRMTLPLFQNHKIWFPEELREDPDMKELIEELEYVTYRGFGSKYDDGADCISQLMMLDSITPPISFDEESYDSKPLKKRSGMWEHHIDYEEDDQGAYSTYV